VNWQDHHAMGRRTGVAQAVVLLATAVLVVAFFRVQVVRAVRYEVQSDSNRLRSVVVSAPRGLITDRTGVVLAENVPGYSVSLHAPSTDSLVAALDRMQGILPTDSADRVRILAQYRAAASEPVVVTRDAPFDAISALEEQRPWNPGLVIRSEPKRRYPFGAAVAHVVGYVGEVSEAELRNRTYPGTRRGSLVGRAGVEQYYDDQLRGRDGLTFAEVDALGRTVREEGIEAGLPPSPGETIRTTIDIELQQFVEQAFPSGQRGAVVAMDPVSGEVLALYSSPSFDPNAFVGGIDPAAWARLTDNRDFPLFDRAIQARYAPASPFKLAVAAMALRRGLVTIDSHMDVPCRGGLQYYNRYFRCWRLQGHGDLTLREAVQYSCDVYFYQLGLKLGLTSLLQDGVEMGFGDPSGIDLPNENEPIFPPSTEYYNRRYGPRGWTSAVTLNLAIGQGENTQTLVNMVRFYAMLASPDGSTPEPRVVAGAAPPPSHALGLSPEALRDLRDALVAVVDRGTAAGAQIADLKIAGKTGTAQNPHGPDHGWFIGFAPADAPTIAVGAVVEFAEHGSSVAPLVTRIMARYLLGADAVRARGPAITIEAPADTAPAPLPILPDSTFLRNQGRDSLGTTAPRTR
jgi:penicillin-binding protein 2